MNQKYFKILTSFLLSFLIILILNYLFFFPNTPKFNQEKIRRNIISIRDNLTILKNKINYEVFNKNKIDYQNQLNNNDEFTNKNYFSLNLAPTKIITPTITFSQPTIFYVNQITPTLIPAFVPTLISSITITPILTPTQIIFSPKPTKIILSPTTKNHTKKITPTSTPAVTNLDVPIINNPFSQPYYNPSKAYLCYNNEKFIEVYANNIKPDSCYSNVKKEVDSNLASVKILGKTITIHKKAYPAFNAVSQELEKNPVAKNYKVNTIGAYIFRCNVNATKGDKFDTCNPNCKLSAHSFGIAVDINWDENCNGCNNYNMPIEIVEIFEKYGFRWGGRYKQIFGATIDAMHFEYMYDLCKDIK
ncbi:MAG: hypothetical protein Fur009_8310 [Candidatus Microgenomates bacterium]